MIPLQPIIIRIIIRMTLSIWYPIYVVRLPRPGLPFIHNSPPMVVRPPPAITILVLRIKIMIIIIPHYYGLFQHFKKLVPIRMLSVYHHPPPPLLRPILTQWSVVVVIPYPFDDISMVKRRLLLVLLLLLLVVMAVVVQLRIQVPIRVSWIQRIMTEINHCPVPDNNAFKNFVNYYFIRKRIILLRIRMIKIRRLQIRLRI